MQSEPYQLAGGFHRDMYRQCTNRTAYENNHDQQNLHMNFHSSLTNNPTCTRSPCQSCLSQLPSVTNVPVVSFNDYSPTAASTALSTFNDGHNRSFSSNEQWYHLDLNHRTQGFVNSHHAEQTVYGSNDYDLHSENLDFGTRMSQQQLEGDLQNQKYGPQTYPELSYSNAQLEPINRSYDRSKDPETFDEEQHFKTEEVQLHSDPFYADGKLLDFLPPHLEEARITLDHDSMSFDWKQEEFLLKPAESSDQYEIPQDIPTFPQRMFPTYPAIIELLKLDQPKSSNRRPIKTGRRTRTSRDGEIDDLIVKGRQQGMSFREIKTRGGLTIAESTLRGRYRNLTKEPYERPRKPTWDDQAIKALKEGVIICTNAYKPQGVTADEVSLDKVPWKKVADWMATERGCHRYGNNAVKKKYRELMSRGRSTGTRGIRYVQESSLQW